MKKFYLKKIREEKELSIRQLAKLSGISHDFLARAERLEKTLSQNSLIKVSKALGLDPEEVLIAYGHLPSYTEEARQKNPNEINKSLKRVTSKIMDEK
jgi:transcriptional regulator with XRE-family HTH domain